MGEEKGPHKVDQSLAPSQPTASAQTPTPTPTQPSGMPNPFTISPMNLNVNPSSLAGLTPENIMAVVGARQNQDQLRMQSYRDLVDSVYKGNAMQRAAEEAPVDRAYKQALTEKAKQDTENDKAIYKTDTGMMLNAKDYLAYQKLTKEDQTPAMKNYEYARSQGFDKSFMEFQDAAKTTHMKDYEAAKEGGYKGTFNTWMTEMAKAGAINIGDLMKKESELTKLQGEKYFSNPDWTKDLQSHIGSKDTQNRIADVQVPDAGTGASKEQKQKAYRDATSRERAKVTIEFIEGKIAASGGKVIADPVMAKDGKTVTWKVQWPTGSITNVTQAVR
jgi:hypothetical protein